MARFPLIVENRLYEMDALQRRAFMDEYDRRRKSVLVGYLLLIPLGWHYAYVKKWGIQVLCWFTLWGFLLWWLIDWFRIPSIINRYNKDLSIKIMTEISLIYGNNPTRATAPEPETALSTWLKQNPGSSINDYYSKFGR
ncbi:TM2 domain-containing protein [Flavobacterium sp. RNTU_13]|uniref:TM2 domain-containing protein n=1 Tax=Flavobacterium sp. RNTU_13 TaxID=3375145 RepID=UPI0039882E4D